MKKFILLSIFCVFIDFCCKSQTDFICYSGPGKVVLNNGETITGNVEYCLSSPARVRILPDGKSDDMKYKSSEVKEFNVGDKQYLSLELKGGAVSVGSDLQFAQLMTPADSKIKVLMSETQSTVVVNNNFAVTTSYYALVPGQEAAYALSDIRFTPFKKMTKYVEDCPVIVEKINNKEKGYFIPMVTTDEARKEVFLKIAMEYQNCK